MVSIPLDSFNKTIFFIEGNCRRIAYPCFHREFFSSIVREHKIDEFVANALAKIIGVDRQTLDMGRTYIIFDFQYRR